MKTAIIVLAAGASRRLGQAKQLLPFKGKTLIEHILDECLKSDIGDVFIILGAKNEIIESKIPPEVNILKNEKWQSGMASSITLGIRNAIVYDAAIIVLADQPHFDNTILEALRIKQMETGTSIVVSKYQKGTGPPVLFLQKHFNELLDLTGDEGAKEVIKKYPNETAWISFKKGNLDIDTESDLSRLL